MIFLPYACLAVFSWSHPHLVALLLNLCDSGWQMHLIKERDGCDISVCAAALNLEAVIRPALLRNHIFYRDCSHIASSTFLACISVIDISLNTNSQQLGSYRSNSGEE